ncbi:MAG: hypothetical protein ACOVOY_00455 [Sediminibacterium sp.]|jgi:hypothetical protein|nr:hypothetical protein [Chitinophagaceae bacterium]MCA6467212.1 hypothetical protein [Chitinophagaceae bacterium]MCA6470479.1 hypothetical protein [Chitinophagaceae bacterium]MCA6477682.1 hypothetical protein [Chitinophagaceae bacterium]MCA6484742.1 hypothetical protein [Chitinophagaceae bacterium]
MKKIWLIFFIYGFSGVGNAQTAREILQMAVAASGGSLWQQPETLELHGTALFTPYGKTDPAHQKLFDTYSMYRIFPGDNKAAHQANGKIRFDAAEGEKMFMQLIFDGSATQNQLSDDARPYREHFSWSNNFGFGIIRFADRDSFLVERLTDELNDGFPCFTVQITDPKKMITVFQIDKKSHLIRGVSFSTTVGYHHRIYGDFKKIKVGNRFFVQPQRVRLFFDGVRWMDIQWQKHRINQPIDDKVFLLAKQ